MPSKIVVTTSPTIVSAARERQMLSIQNQSAGDVYLAWDSTASAVTVDSGASPGMKLVNGASFTFIAEAKFPVSSMSGAIYAVVASGTSNLSVQEQ